MAYPPMPVMNIDRMVRSEMAAEQSRRRKDLRERVAAKLFVGALEREPTMDADDEQLWAKWSVEAAARLADAAYPTTGD